MDYADPSAVSAAAQPAPADRTLLLVDDEPNIVSSLKRLLRRDSYRILTANSGQEGLDLLAQHAVDVIVSDQRMPGMLGVDFLRAAKDRYPHTIRIMLSGYTELQSVTDAVNEGAIYKFLTKPWEDNLLRGHIEAAFRVKESADENERLNRQLRVLNVELAEANRKLSELLLQKQQQITLDEINLSVAHEVLQLLPIAVIGVDDEGVVAFVNEAADQLLHGQGAILGREAGMVLPQLFAGGGGTPCRLIIDKRRYEVMVRPMGTRSSSRGSLVTICQCEAMS
jgi:CheY-like chemotaxis protein